VVATIAVSIMLISVIGILNASKYATSEKRINKILKDIDRNGYNCIGKPEKLSDNLSGFWSARIDEKNRIVFRIVGDMLEIAECGSHYGD